MREQEEESARALSPSERQHVRESVLGEGDTAGAKPRIRETAALDGIGDWFRQLAHRQDAKFHERQHRIWFLSHTISRLIRDGPKSPEVHGSQHQKHTL